MSVKLLYNKSRKATKEVQRPTLNRETYYDTESIRETIGEVGEKDLLRVKLVRTEPVKAYRVSIIRHYNNSHTTKIKDDRTVLLKPGLYCAASWFVTKRMDGFVWEASHFNDKGFTHVGNV